MKANSFLNKKNWCQSRCDYDEDLQFLRALQMLIFNRRGLKSPSTVEGNKKINNIFQFLYLLYYLCM